MIENLHKMEVKRDFSVLRQFMATCSCNIKTLLYYAVPQHSALLQRICTAYLGFAVASAGLDFLQRGGCCKVDNLELVLSLFSSWMCCTVVFVPRYLWATFEAVNINTLKEYHVANLLVCYSSSWRISCIFVSDISCFFHLWYRFYALVAIMHKSHLNNEPKATCLILVIWFPV